MKPWITEPGWLERYTDRVLALKHIQPSEVTRMETYTSIKTAFNTVYRAVAFDIDGTLTPYGDTAVDPRMAEVVGSLLQRSVPVVLITGRDIPKAREAAKAIQNTAGLSGWYMRRLFCITQNGVYLLQTPTEVPTDLLGEEELLVPEGLVLSVLLDKLKRIVEAEGLSTENFASHDDKYSLRLVFHQEEHRTKVKCAIDLAIDSLAQEAHLPPEQRLYTCIGSFGTKSCLDIVCTTKLIALEAIARHLGIGSDRILRIGDQGQEDGNDFELLNCNAGFSVSKLSSCSEGCFPILDADLAGQMSGPSATEHLTKQVLLFPPLSIAPNHPELQLAALRKFETLALSRSRNEAEMVTQRIRVRLRYLLTDVDAGGMLATLGLSDISDPFSGGVRLRDSELDELNNNQPVLDLFDCRHISVDNPIEPKCQYSMFTDTGILMRGPLYYFSRTTQKKDMNVDYFISCVAPFVHKAISVIKYLRSEGPSLLNFKIVLAIQDNIRNFLLQLLYIAYSLETATHEYDYTRTKRLYHSAMYPHTKLHYNFLLNLDAGWLNSLNDYHSLLVSLDEIINDEQQSFRDLAVAEQDGSIDVFKWRECDNFLQNITAAQLGLQEILQRKEVRDAKRLVAVGIAYGGIELPILASVIAEVRGDNLGAAITRVSHYSNEQDRDQVRKGASNYVETLSANRFGLCIFDDVDQGPGDATFIIMDDNCTTCITMQLTRDLLLMQGADVVGAIIVRFPSVNRHVQMGLPDHGFPDPEILFSFVRGLVAPSPYSRLIIPNPNPRNKYLDQTEIFDKAKTRIDRYLKKNGTPGHELKSTL